MRYFSHSYTRFIQIGGRGCSPSMLTSCFDQFKRQSHPTANSELANNPVSTFGPWRKPTNAKENMKVKTITISRNKLHHRVMFVSCLCLLHMSICYVTPFTQRIKGILFQFLLWMPRSFRSVAFWLVTSNNLIWITTTFRKQILQQLLHLSFGFTSWLFCSLSFSLSFLH